VQYLIIDPEVGRYWIAECSTNRSTFVKSDRFLIYVYESCPTIGVGWNIHLVTFQKTHGLQLSIAQPLGVEP
jgi:hypothetical protein